MDTPIDSRLIGARYAGSGRRSWLASTVGAIGALTLHLALLSALSLGTSTGRPPRSHAGAPGATPSADDRAVSAVILMDPTVLSNDEDIEAPAVRMRPPAVQDFPISRLVQLSAAEPGIGGQDENSESRKSTATTAVDGAGRAMLFGRYVSQISARIEDLWIRPQSPPAGASFRDPLQMARGARSSDRAVAFRCRVQVLQSRGGQVLEVTLLDCDRSPEWQQSLVNAIDAASPLPAPPSQSVFARSLVLNFTSAQVRRTP